MSRAQEFCWLAEAHGMFLVALFAGKCHWTPDPELAMRVSGAGRHAVATAAASLGHQLGFRKVLAS